MDDLSVQDFSFPRFSAYRLSKPHTGAPSVLVDEFDAGGFGCPESAVGADWRVEPQ
jgi:hypothetical protein